MRSAPARPVRALCEAVAVLLSKNMTCARPRCNATSSKHFPHTSHCTLHTSHLSFFHLVSCLPICQLRSSWLFSCHLSAAQTFSCVGAIFNLSRRFCTSARLSVTPKPNLDATAEKDDFEALWTGKGFLEGKFLAPKLRKSADKSLSQPGCSHSNTIYEIQLQKTIVSRMQPRHQATLTQPLQCDLQRLSCKAQ